MSLGLDQLRELVVSYLADSGIAAVTAWGDRGRQLGDCPVVAVSLRKCSAGQSGFANYLGEQYNTELEQWEEIYARKVSVTLGLDIYAPVDVGEEAVVTVFDQLVAALAYGAPAGMNLDDISCGETGYDEGERLLKRTVEAGCSLYLYAVTAPGETFLDFRVKGGLLT